jgi:hypothetical protein
MVTFVMTFTGAPSQFEPALARLREQVPAASFTRKTTTLVEASLTVEDAEAVALSTEWTLAPATTAEISPPGTNFRRMREQLGKGRT